MPTPRNQFFDALSDPTITGVAFKNLILKKKIIQFLDKKGNATINEIGSRLKTSSPKVNNLIQELMESQLVADLGKVETGVGRRPQIFGLLSSSIYFLGVDVSNHKLEIGLVNFKEEMVHLDTLPFELENNQESLDRLIALLSNFMDSNSDWKGKIVRIGVNLSGRVNHNTGFSHNYFNFHPEPLSEVLREELGIITYIENDTRAKAFGEFRKKDLRDKKNVLFVNADYGIGLGVMINGQLHYGKSGYSGEFGHIPFFNNEIICRCGKKGCLETEASGRALVEDFRSALKSGSTSSLQRTMEVDRIQMEDIIQAAIEDDMLAIELIGAVGSKLGKGISTLIHLYNPELILFGGALTATGDHFFLPLQMAVNKFSLNLVKNDTALMMSEADKGTGVWGACLLAKHMLINSK